MKDSLSQEIQDQLEGLEEGVDYIVRKSGFGGYINIVWADDRGIICDGHGTVENYGSPRRYGIWAGNTKGSAFDPQRCIHEVLSGWHNSQCSRKVSEDTQDGLYCKQHDPVRIAKKHAIRDAKWEEEQIQRKWKHEKPKMFEEALRKIAEGTLNDPTSYAQLILEDIKDQDDKMRT